MRGFFLLLFLFVFCFDRFRFVVLNNFRGFDFEMKSDRGQRLIGRI